MYASPPCVICKSHPVSARSTPNIGKSEQPPFIKTLILCVAQGSVTIHSFIHSFVRTLARFTVAFERKIIPGVLRRKREKKRESDTNNNDTALIMKVYYCRLLYCNTRRTMILIILFINCEREEREEWEVPGEGKSVARARGLKEKRLAG